MRLLAAGLLGGALTSRWRAPAAAQPHPDVDYDADGLTNDDEVNVYGTDPSSGNTDGDGLNDGEEIYFGTNPLVPDGASAPVDHDTDGRYDSDETNVYGTDPYVTDTDNDGVGDGAEVSYGMNPLQAPPPGSVEIGNVGSECYARDAAGNCTCSAVDSNGNRVIGVADPRP